MRDHIFSRANSIFSRWPSQTLRQPYVMTAPTPIKYQMGRRPRTGMLRYKGTSRLVKRDGNRVVQGRVEGVKRARWRDELGIVQHHSHPWAGDLEAWLLGLVGVVVWPT